LQIMQVEKQSNLMIFCWPIRIAIKNKEFHVDYFSGFKQSNIALIHSLLNNLFN